jgi:O-antigen ligase
MLELSTLTALTIVVFTLSILMTRFDLVQNCRFDKCGFRAETLALGGTQNSFSIVIAGLSIVALLFTKRLNFFIIFSSFSLYLTSLGGSRTALIAQALCTTFLMFFKKEHLSLLKKISFIAIFLIVLLISALPVFLTFDRSFITGRGRLWEYAKESLGSNLILGNGPSFWTSLFSEAGFYANYGTHNIWLDSLVSFGLVGTFLFLLLILDIFKTSIFSPYGVLVLYVLLIGTTESSFQVWKFTHGTVLLFLFLFSLRVSKPKFESIQN